MDLDFILIVVGYLAIVLFLHYYIKINNLGMDEKGKDKPKKILKKEKIRLEDEESHESNTSIEDDDKYMRYLQEEDNNKRIENVIETKKEDSAFDDSLYILMLLRVYRHCRVDTPEHLLITEEIKRLWN